MQPETTPNWVRDYVVANFPVTFNPVEQHDFDGLNEEWPGGPNQVCFVNCAFADAQLWVEKAVKELKKEKPTASVLFVPLVFNATYFRETVYPNAAEIHIFTCPIKQPGKSKQVVAQVKLFICIH